jgi:CheY-like chemotaxis protein
VVFVTANSDPSCPEEAEEAGANSFITKPINRTTLLGMCRSLLQLKKG